MLKRMVLIACALALSAPLLLAQAPPPPGPGPMMPCLAIPLPEGMMPPPPEAGPEAFEAFVAGAFAAIAGDDGVITLDELKAAMKKGEPAPPMPPEGPKPPEGMPLDGPKPPEGFMPPEGGPLAGLPDPPVCDGSMVSNELLPQAVDSPCGTSMGNLIFRTVCNAPGYNGQAISLPAGRTASCFGIEAITKNVVILKIYPEADPATLLFDSTRDGLENIGAVMGSLAPAADTVYRIELDMAASAPDARVTVRFVDF